MDVPAGNPVSESARFGTKLLETVKDFTEPSRVRRLAIASREASRLETEAQVERLLDVGNANAKTMELAARTKMRLATEWMRQQQNIDSTVNEAFTYQPETVSEEPVDPDWVSRFFRGCEDISDPTMRTILAKILAGEVGKPKSFSRRTLSIVRDMGRDDIARFERVCEFLWSVIEEGEVEPSRFIPSVHSLQSGKVQSDAFGLTSIGLGIGGSVRVKGSVVFTYAHENYQFVLPSPSGINGFIFTESGCELSRLFPKKQHDAWRDDCLKGMKEYLRIVPQT